MPKHIFEYTDKTGLRNLMEAVGDYTYSSPAAFLAVAMGR